MKLTSKKTPLSSVAQGTVALVGKAKLTKWTASQPVTKQLSLAADGTVHKVSTAAQLYEGGITRLECDPVEFIKVLQSIGSNDCLSYGLPINASATHITTKVKFEAANRPVHLMARLASAMAWPSGPGIMLGDYDPEDTALTPAELRDALYKCCPPLRDAAHIWAASTSSCLTNAKTGEEVRGIRGQRVYTFVADATDIPRAAGVLAKRAWLNGCGYIKVSKAGSMLERNIIDGAVYQTNRIDYCAPPICEAPLKQNKPKPQLHGAPKLALDTRVALPDLTVEQQAQYEQLVHAAKAAKAPEAKVIRDQHIQTRAADYVAKGMNKESAVCMITQMLETQVLSPDFLLTSEDGIQVSVAELLRNRAEWHGKNFHDPVEPEYHGDDRIARAYLNGPGRPLIRSFAHGGCTYFLSHAAETIQLNPGERHTYMQQMAKVLKERGEFYVRANELVSVDVDNKFVNHNALTVLSVLDRSFRFEAYSKKDKKRVPTDPPKDLAQLFHAAFVPAFLPIKCIITAPIMCPLTQRLITVSGYDAETGVFAVMPDDVWPVIERPTTADLEDALAVLWRCVSLFPFVDPIDDTIMLTAMLTAVMRPLLPTAPGFAFDAAVQSSGKSLLTSVLSALSGVAPLMSPWPHGQGAEAEVKKTIFAKLLEGRPVITFDNVVGEVDSPSLAAVLTAPADYSDRILGKSRSGEAHTNTLILMSGNNLKLVGDLPRRILKSRIDPKLEKPHQRIFDFSPLTLAQALRQQMVAAALTLIKGYFAANIASRLGVGRTGSFEVWDDTVRQTLCWLAGLQKAGKLPQGTLPDGRIFPRLVDPFIAIDDAIDDDPTLLQLGRLLSAWAAQVGTGFGTRLTVKSLVDRRFTASTQPGQVVKPDADNPPLHEVLSEIAANPTTGAMNTRKLGSYLAGQKDRLIDGLRIKEGETHQNALTWWVEDVGELRESGESVLAVTNKKSNVSILKPVKSDSRNSPDSPAAKPPLRPKLKAA